MGLGLVCLVQLDWLELVGWMDSVVGIGWHWFVGIGFDWLGSVGWGGVGIVGIDLGTLVRIGQYLFAEIGS